MSKIKKAKCLQCKRMRPIEHLERFGYSVRNRLTYICQDTDNCFNHSRKKLIETLPRGERTP